MEKKNKMEASDPDSIMDWFIRHGMDGSYHAREKFFRSRGFPDYKGTFEQNVTLLKMLKEKYGDNLPEKDTSKEKMEKK